MGGGSEVPFPCLDREHLRAVTTPSPLRMGPVGSERGREEAASLLILFRLRVGSSECKPQTFSLEVGVGK